MSVAKISEISSTSPSSFDDAVKQGIARSRGDPVHLQVEGSLTGSDDAVVDRLNIRSDLRDDVTEMGAKVARDRLAVDRRELLVDAYEP